MTIYGNDIELSVHLGVVDVLIDLIFMIYALSGKRMWEITQKDRACIQ